MVGVVLVVVGCASGSGGSGAVVFVPTSGSAPGVVETVESSTTTSATAVVASTSATSSTVVEPELQERGGYPTLHYDPPLPVRWRVVEDAAAAVGDCSVEGVDQESSGGAGVAVFFAGAMVTPSGRYDSLGHDGLGSVEVAAFRGYAVPRDKFEERGFLRTDAEHYYHHYRLELRDSAGAVLRSVPFGVHSGEINGWYSSITRSHFFNILAVTKPRLSAYEDYGVGNRYPYFFSVRLPEGAVYDSLAITYEGVEVFAVPRSEAAPVVEFCGGISPGEVISKGDVARFFLRVSDPDGGSLRFWTYASHDGGGVYFPYLLESSYYYDYVEPDFDNDKKYWSFFEADVAAGEELLVEVSFPLQRLESWGHHWGPGLRDNFFVPIDASRVAVGVSDGTRSVFVETPVFGAVGNTPFAWLSNPAVLDLDEPSTPCADEPGSSRPEGLDRSYWYVGLDGRNYLSADRGFDWEDLEFGGEAFSWHSSIDGELGVGRRLCALAPGKTADGAGAAGGFEWLAVPLTPGEHVISLTITDSSGLTYTRREKVLVS